MSVAQPTATTKRSSAAGTSHSLLHRIIAADTDAAAQSLVVNSDGSTTMTLVKNSTIASKVSALTDAATIATNAALGNVFTVTLGGNRTLGAPTNPVDGQKVVWRFKQDGTGNRTISLNAIFRVATDIGSVTLSTTAAVTDYMGAIYNADDVKWDVIALMNGIS